MSQINVNPPAGDGGDRTGAAGINLITVVIVLLVLLAVAYFLFTSGIFGGRTTNVNVNPPAKGTGSPFSLIDGSNDLNRYYEIT